MGALVFGHSREGVVKLSSGALATMRSFAQLGPDDLEAGGILLGRLLRDNHDVVVDLATTPKPDDVRERFGFERNHGHQTEIDAAWKNSEGTCIFLGEWHTHAEPSPTPSSVDLENMRRVLTKDVRENEPVFFVIVGQQSVVCWERTEGTTLRECALVRELSDHAQAK